MHVDSEVPAGCCNSAASPLSQLNNIAFLFFLSGNDALGCIPQIGRGDLITCPNYGI